MQTTCARWAGHKCIHISSDDSSTLETTPEGVAVSVEGCMTAEAAMHQDQSPQALLVVTADPAHHQQCWWLREILQYLWIAAAVL